MTRPASEGCPACTGRGWLLTLDAGAASFVLHRCDSCCRFGSNQEARRWVSSSGSTLAAVFFELGGVLAAEADSAVSDKKKSASRMGRVLKTIRDSLQNALTLESEQSSLPTPAADSTAPGPGSAGEKTYIVGVREVHVRHYKVKADDPESAKALVSRRASEAVDLEFEEYSHELDPGAWSAEENDGD